MDINSIQKEIKRYFDARQSSWLAGLNIIYAINIFRDFFQTFHWTAIIISLVLSGVCIFIVFSNIFTLGLKKLAFIVIIIVQLVLAIIFINGALSWGEKQVFAWFYAAIGIWVMIVHILGINAVDKIPEEVDILGTIKREKEINGSYAFRKFNPTEIVYFDRENDILDTEA